MCANPSHGKKRSAFVFLLPFRTSRNLDKRGILSCHARTVRLDPVTAGRFQGLLVFIVFMMV